MVAGNDSSTLVKLVFGDTILQVQADAHGGLEALSSEVEAKLGLHPGSFTIYDIFGKVDDSHGGLQRALDMAAEECVLEVRESPEWRKIREMDEKINMLVARCPVVDNALASIEERSAMRFEKLASAMQAVEERSSSRSTILCQGVEDLDNKVINSIAPLLQSVALQDMELKAKLDSLSASLVSEEMETKVNCSIAPMLQSMALQQMDLKEKLACLEESASRSCASIAELVLGTRKEFADFQAYSVKVDEQLVEATKGMQKDMHAAEEVSKKVQKELEARKEDMADASQQLKALQVEVHTIAEKASKSGTVSKPTLSAMQQDLMKSPKNSKNSLGGVGGDEWIEGSVSDLFAYSKKSHMNINNLGGAVPFARYGASRQLDRLQGSRSLPHLPPVK